MGAKVAVLGAGSWGTALAAVAARCGNEVLLWGRRAGQVRQMMQTRHNPDYLQQYELAPAINPTADLGEALRGSDVVLVAVASSGIRDFAGRLALQYPGGAPVVSVTKGLEPGSDLRMTQVLAEELESGSEELLCALSGPNFAGEIIRGLPAGTVVACRDEECARRVQQVLSGPGLRVYTSDDLVGVELGGALKNVYAIAVGMVDSLGLGVNIQSTLITRGLAELARLGVRLGAHPFTFAGLSGLGDMVLTCTSDLSRNRRAGLALGRGQTVEEIVATGETVEGIRATRAVRELAHRCDVEMPIAEQLHQILFAGKAPTAAVEELMERAARTEREEEFVTGSGILGGYRP